MHIQIHSKELRSFIPHEKYFALMAEERRRSFIGLNLQHCAAEMIEKRLLELEELEKSGFVYVGEKNWLLSWKQGEDQAMQSYSNWVKNNFANYLKLNFEIDETYLKESGPGKVWKAEMDASKFLLGFEELKNPDFEEIDELDIYVAGDEQKLSYIHLVQAFEFLHNLEYCLQSFPPRKSTYSPLGITGIEVCNRVDPTYWELIVISEYGSEWDETLVQGHVWRKS